MPRSDPISLEVLESLPDGILALNPSGGIDAFNQHLASLWHLPADVLDGRKAKGVVPPGSPPVCCGGRSHRQGRVPLVSPAAHRSKAAPDGIEKKSVGTRPWRCDRP